MNRWEPKTCANTASPLWVSRSAHGVTRKTASSKSERMGNHFLNDGELTKAPSCRSFPVMAARSRIARKVAYMSRIGTACRYKTTRATLRPAKAVRIASDRDEEGIVMAMMIQSYVLSFLCDVLRLTARLSIRQRTTVIAPPTIHSCFPMFLHFHFFLQPSRKATTSTP
jgi:hypothetical protein